MTTDEYGEILLASVPACLFLLLTIARTKIMRTLRHFVVDLGQALFRADEIPVRQTEQSIAVI